MKKYIPRDKLSKKARKELNAKDRNTWNGLNPATRVVENKKIYNRKKTRIKYDDYFTGLFDLLNNFKLKKYPSSSFVF